MQKDRIIVSEKNIDKAFHKIDQLDQTAFNKVVDQFIKEQPVLTSYLTFIQKEESEDYFDELIYHMLIIWTAFKNEVKTLEQVSEAIIETVSSRSEKGYKDLLRDLRLKDENEVAAKMNEFNQRIQELEPGTGIDKLAEEMGKDFEIIMKYSRQVAENMHQPELYDFLLYSLDIQGDINAAEEDSRHMLSQLMTCVHFFDELVNSPFQLLATPGGKLPAQKKSKGSKHKNQVYQLKISLKGITPMIWRRVLVDDLTLDDLHEVIQYSMGWEDYHLYEFKINGKSYMIQEENSFDMEKTIDPMTVSLHEVIREEKQLFEYTYDFGDAWEHKVVVEKILERVPKINYPICLDGKQNCPPEDCGGIWGYSELLEIMANKKHPEYKNMLDWLGEKYDAEAFYLEEVNEDLRVVFGE